MQDLESTKTRAINPSDIRIKPSSPELATQSGQTSTDDANGTTEQLCKPITFTQFSGPPNSRLTKAFSLDGDGNIVKDSTPNFSSGDAESVGINTLPDIQAIIESLQSNECIATGVYDEASCKIVTVDAYRNMADKSGFRTRTCSPSAVSGQVA